MLYDGDTILRNAETGENLAARDETTTPLA
jgi:hypothetical protein